MTPEESLEFDLEWSYASMLGEAVWARMCDARQLDPKAPSVREAHDEVVRVVRGAAFVLARDGFEGLAGWLKDERELGVTDALGVTLPKVDASRPASTRRNRVPAASGHDSRGRPRPGSSEVSEVYLTGPATSEGSDT